MLRVVFPLLFNNEMSSTNKDPTLAKIVQVVNNVDVPFQIFDFKQKGAIELGKKDFGNVAALVEIRNGLITVNNVVSSDDLLISVGGRFLRVSETVEWLENTILRIGFRNVYFYNVLRSDDLHKILMKECFARDAKTHDFSNNESNGVANDNVSTATTFHTATTGSGANRRLGDLTVRERNSPSSNASISATLDDSSIEILFGHSNYEEEEVRSVSRKLWIWDRFLLNKMIARFCFLEMQGKKVGDYFELRRFHKPTHTTCPTDMFWCRNLRKFYGAMIDQLPICSECRNKRTPVVNWNNFQIEICGTKSDCRRILCPVCLIDLAPEQREKFVAYNQNDQYYNRQYALFRKKYDELMKTVKKTVSKRAEFLSQVRQLTATVLKNMENLETVTEDLTVYINESRNSIFSVRFLSRMSENRRRVLFEKVETYLNGAVKAALEEAREAVANHELMLLEFKKLRLKKWTDIDL